MTEHEGTMLVLKIVLVLAMGFGGIFALMTMEPPRPRQRRQWFPAWLVARQRRFLLEKMKLDRAKWLERRRRARLERKRSP